MEWIDEDPELVNATLTFLASLESSDPGHRVACNRISSSAYPSTWSNESCPSSPEETTLDLPPKTKDARAVNSSRERLRKELVELRYESAQLESQLAALKQHRNDQLRHHYRGGELLTVAPVWESLAIRQFKARKKAEQANQRLLSMLDNQRRVADELLVAIRRAEQQREPGYPTYIPHKLSIPRAIRARMADQDLTHRLDQMVAYWRDAFTVTTEFRDGKLQFRDVQFEEGHASEAAVHLWTSSVVPAEVPRVAETMWALLTADMVDDDAPTFTEESRLSNDEMIAIFTANARMDDLSGDLYGKIRSKRLRLAKDEYLHVMLTYMELGGFHNELDDVVLIEECWIRLIDARELGHRQIGAPLTVIQHVRRTRVCFGLKGDWIRPDATVLAMINKFVVVQIDEELKWARQALENALMDPPRLALKVEPLCVN